MPISKRKFGHLEVICGPMFSGKTEELIRRITKVEFTKKKAIVFKPIIDTRYSKTHIQSQKIDSTKDRCLRIYNLQRNREYTRHRHPNAP